MPLAGVPVKAAAEYLRQLVGGRTPRRHLRAGGGSRSSPRGLVRREVVETADPGALLQEGWVAGRRNNWMVALERGGSGDGTSASPPIDLSTGEFVLETVPADGLEEALSRLNPAEIVVSPVTTRRRCLELACSAHRRVSAWEFDPELAREELARRFSLASLDGLGVGPGRCGAPSAPPARCSAIWASSSPAACPIWPGPSSAGATPSSGSTR